MIPKKVVDVCVVGSGPGGYVAAIRCAQLGLQVAIIEDQYIGGTCLNVGCIPSKVLLDDSKLWAQLSKLGDRGITIGNQSIDYSVLQQRRAKVVGQLVGGVDLLLEQNGIQKVKGRGVFQGPGQIRADDPATGFIQVVEYDFAIIATGSVPATIPGFVFDGVNIVSSTEALEWSAPPKRLVVIGAGAIGLELASVWSRFGSQVTIVEYLDRIAATMDEEVSKRALPLFKQQGLDIRLSSQAKSATVAADGTISVVIQPRDGGAEETLSADKVLVAVGRKPASANLGLERVDVATTEKGFIKVDNRQRTNVRGIFAIGDVVGGIQYAHKAMEEGIIAAENIGGRPAIMDRVIPGAIFTSPEIAHVGATEQELKEAGTPYRKGSFKFAAAGKALSLGEPEGFAKVLAGEDGTLLGVHILGAHASDVIAEAALAMELGATLEDIQSTVHTHPSLAEAFHEATLAADRKAIHQVNPAAAAVPR